MSAEPQMGTQTWQEAEQFLDGASEAEALDYLQDIAGLMDYEFGNIKFEAMPDHVGGYTHTDYKVDNNGEVIIHGDEIYLNEKLLPGEREEQLIPVPSLFRDTIDFYDETAGLQDTFYHELGHGKQYRDIWSTEEPYTEEELGALLPFHEGQTSYNADDTSYRDMNELYEQFIDAVYEDGQAPGDVLEDISEQYRIDVVYLEDGEDGVYDFVVSDRDTAEEDVYELAENAYGMDVLKQDSYEVDLQSFDTDKLGEHLVRVQDELDAGFERVAEEYGADALPIGYEETVAEQ